MKKSVEQLAKEIFNECKADGEPVTEAEALEMAKMELGAKEIKRYEKAATASKKPRKKRERKVDEEKKKILEDIVALFQVQGVNILNVKTETEIEFSYHDNHYSLKLTKHRTKK